MERARTPLAEETRAWFAEQGVHVTEEGLARARQKLRDAERRMTPEAKARVDAIFEPEQPAT
jgi:hypothetical protein